MKFLLDETAPIVWLSPPARGAWIEMRKDIVKRIYTKVAPRTGGVD